MSRLHRLLYRIPESKDLRLESKFRRRTPSSLTGSASLSIASETLAVREEVPVTSSGTLTDRTDHGTLMATGDY